MHKVLESLDAFFDSKSVNVYELAPSILAAPKYVQEGIFTVCIHFLSIVADRGLEGAYVNHPQMEENSAMARRMMGDSLD